MEMRSLGLFFIFGLAGCGEGSSLVQCDPSEASASYVLEFTGTWSETTHPTDFPSNPHFSGLIGATHQAGYKLWEPGRQASAGVQAMAESGDKTSLVSEIESAKSSIGTDILISGGGIANSPGSASVAFNVNSSQPLVSVTSMIAPSPDWFVGVRDLALCENNEWVAEKVVDVFAYDAGTDSGESFSSENLVTAPKTIITQIAGGDFETSFGSFRFVKQ